MAEVYCTTSLLYDIQLTWVLLPLNKTTNILF